MNNQKEILFYTLKNDCKVFNVEFKGTKLEILNNLENAYIEYFKDNSKISRFNNMNLCKNKLEEYLTQLDYFEIK